MVFMDYPQITVSPDGTGVTTISPISFMGGLLLSFSISVILLLYMNKEAPVMGASYHIYF